MRGSNAGMPRGVKSTMYKAGSDAGVVVVWCGVVWCGCGAQRSYKDWVARKLLPAGYYRMVGNQGQQVR